MPALKLTTANIRTLPAIDGKRTEYRDELVSGLVLRVSPEGTRTWHVTYHLAGRGKRYKLGRLEALGLGGAREEARKLRARVALGEDPQQLRNDERRLQVARRGALTVAGLVERYLAAAILRDSTRKEWRRLLSAEVSRPGVGDQLAGELGRFQVRELGRRIAERSPSAAIHVHELLRAAYRWAVEEDLLPGSPFIGLRPPAQRKRRARVLTPAELRGVLQALHRGDSQYEDATLLLLLTLVRRSMVVGMRADELHELAGSSPLWIVPPERVGMKQRQRSEMPLPHLVPLSAPAAAIFRRRLEGAGVRGHIFPQTRPRRRGEKRKADTLWWSSRFVAGLRRRAEEALGTPMERWTIHDLRRTAATLMREHLGVSREVVRLLLVHRAPADATAIYDRSELLAERRSALVSWAAWLDRLELGGSEVPKVVPLPGRAMVARKQE